MPRFIALGGALADNAFRGMRYEFLPPYSPDFNPIELAFSTIKYRLRSNGEIARLAMSNKSDDSDVHALLSRLVWEISPRECFGWYRMCGYV